jgi:hypothetical protein
MALRPFTRNPKKSEEDEEAAPSDTGDAREFFSVDPRPADPSAADPAADDGPPPRMSVPKPPTVSMPEDAEPGWYPDQADPGLVRYWDGFHLTGQSMRVERPAAQAGGAKSMIAVEAADTTSPVAAAPTAVAQPIATKAAPAPAAAPAADGAPEDRSAEVGAPSRPELILFDESTAATPTEELESAPPPPVRAGPAPAEPAAPAATPSSDRPSTAQAPEHHETWTAMREIGKGTAEADDAITATEELVTATAADDGHDGEPAPVTEASPPEDPGTRAGDVAEWAQETERAVAKAQATGTPDAWQEAARAAAVVTEMAQTMRSLAEATRVAGEKARAAHDAVEAAKVAEQETADAKVTAEQTSTAALEAAEAAKVAGQAAAEAKQIAERTAQAMPKLAAVARAAVQASTDAEQTAKGLEGIVIKARTTNTPEAWSEALVLASAATGTGQAPTPEA